MIASATLHYRTRLTTSSLFYLHIYLFAHLFAHRESLFRAHGSSAGCRDPCGLGLFIGRSQCVVGRSCIACPP